MNFEKFPPQRDIISEIFPNQEDFRKKVKETLEWSRKGGPMVGTPLFLKAVVGNINITPQEFVEINQRIKQEVKQIKAEEKQSSSQSFSKNKTGKVFNKKDKQKMIKGAEDWEKSELERSGGVNPNE